MKNLYIGILAGGNGTRLWPLSTPEIPKQIIPFLNGKSLLQQTIDRVQDLVALPENIFVVTSKRQEAVIKNHVKDTVGFFVTEPEGRNTAPAILLSCKKIFAKNPEAIVLFLPADHFIPSKKAYLSVASRVIEYALQNNSIGIFGLKPTSAATGYGYIHAQLESNQEQGDVIKFHEKPDIHRAQAYLARDDMFWNLGMFASKAKTFLQEFEIYAPQLVADVDKYLSGQGSYADVQKISIDHAIMEQSKKLVMFSGSFEWYDVGNLAVFLTLQQHFGNLKEVIQVDARNNIAQTSKKVVACIGVDDLCIVETSDTLLIVKREKAEKVKEIVSKVKEVVC